MSRFQRTPDPDRSGQMLLEAGEPVGLVYWSHDYTDREGNRTSFDFSGYHKRAATADLFTFTAPAGVQVVSAD